MVVVVVVVLLLLHLFLHHLAFCLTSFLAWIFAISNNIVMQRVKWRWLLTLFLSLWKSPSRYVARAFLESFLVVSVSSFWVVDSRPRRKSLTRLEREKKISNWKIRGKNSEKKAGMTEFSKEKEKKQTNKERILLQNTYCSRIFLQLKNNFCNNNFVHFDVCCWWSSSGNCAQE